MCFNLSTVLFLILCRIAFIKLGSQNQPNNETKRGDPLQSPAMHLNWPLSTFLALRFTFVQRARSRRKRKRTGAFKAHNDKQYGRDHYGLGKVRTLDYLRLSTLVSGFMASMDVDHDDKPTAEQREALDEENRAKELREQAGMRIVLHELFYLIIVSSSSVFMDTRIRGTRHNRTCTSGYTWSRSGYYSSEKETKCRTKRP